MAKKSRVLLGFTLLVILIVILLVVNVRCGSVSLSWNQILDVLSGKADTDRAYMIIWNIRIPRILASFILGGALAVSGLMLQTFFSNPIAGPYILGISSGAKLTVALTMVFTLKYGIMLSSPVLITALHSFVLFFNST